VNLYVSDQQYAYARKTERAYVVVVINNDNKPSTIEFDVSPLGAADGALLIDRLGVAGDAKIQSGMLKVSLPARSASVLTLK